MTEATATIIIKELIKTNGQIKGDKQINEEHKNAHNTWTKAAIQDLSTGQIKSAIYAIDMLAYAAKHNLKDIDIADQLTELNSLLENARS